MNDDEYFHFFIHVPCYIKISQFIYKILRPIKQYFEIL